MCVHTRTSAHQGFLGLVLKAILEPSEHVRVYDSRGVCLRTDRCVRAEGCVLIAVCMRTCTVADTCMCDSLSIRLGAAKRGLLLSFLVVSETRTHLFAVSVLPALCLVRCLNAGTNACMSK